MSVFRGRAVSALVENLPQAGQSRQLICVPIIGGPSGKLESRYHVNTLTYSAAAKLKGESHLADFPALLDNPLIRNGIMQSQHFKTISAYWDNLDVALVELAHRPFATALTGMRFMVVKRVTT